jgi:hypothetical protein
LEILLQRLRKLRNRIVAEALKTHAGRLCDFTYVLAAEWRAGNGKTAA